MATVGINEFYRYYRGTSKDPIDQSLYKRILRDYNDMLMDMLIEKGQINMQGLGKLTIMRKKTNPANPIVDWNTSLQIKEEFLRQGKKLWDGKEGEKWVTHFDQPWYPMFHWEKNSDGVRVRNKKLYVFQAARGMTGPKEKLKRRLRNDDLAHLTYKWAYHANLQIRKR